MAAKCVVCDTDLHCKVEPCDHGESVAWYCPECVIESLREEVEHYREYYKADLDFCAVRFWKRMGSNVGGNLKKAFYRKRDAKKAVEELELRSALKGIPVKGM